MKRYFIRIPCTGLFVLSPRWFYNIWPWAGVVESQENKKINHCDIPSNDGDIDGIYRYLCWQANESGMGSVFFHYLEVLKQRASNDQHPGN